MCVCLYVIECVYVCALCVFVSDLSLCMFVHISAILYMCICLCVCKCEFMYMDVCALCVFVCL